MMKNGQLSLVFAAAFAALLAGCPGPVHMDADTGPMPDGDGGMPDAYVMPPDDGGTDAYVDTGHDAGMPGACTPDQIAAGTPDCMSCYCDMPTFMMEACTSQPELCRTGDHLRNTCGMTSGTNRCGFNLPLGSTGDMMPYVGGFSSTCSTAFNHTLWQTGSGTQFCVDLMMVNGQTTVRFSDESSGCEVVGTTVTVGAAAWTCQNESGSDTCYSNSSNADLTYRYYAMHLASDCMSANVQGFNGGAGGDIFFSAFR